MTNLLNAVCAAAFLAAPAALFAWGSAERGASADEPTAAGIFPVEPAISMLAGHTWSHDPTDNPWVQSWGAPTGVNLEWVWMGAEQMPIVFASDNSPDMMFGVAGGHKNLIAGMLQNGVVADLRPHLGKGYTPNLDRIFAEKPEALAYMLNPQGQMQALARFHFLESNYLEQNYMINRRWLDALGLDAPTTTGELRDVLIAFRDGDPNGNGKADEIPFAFVVNDGFAQHLRSMYGIWGMPTKNGIAIRDGQAYFAPITQGYRDLITYMADLYSEGLIDPESFTMNSNDFNAKVDDPSGNIYGFVVARRGFTPVNEATANRGEFESIPPLRAPGYEPEMWVHPGRLAIKNVWFMTDVNPYPQHTMAFVDRFYTLENSVQAQFGFAPEGIAQENGVWVPQPIDPERRAQIATAGTFPSIFREEDFGPNLAMDTATQFLFDQYYEHYVRFKAKEQWVRAEFASDEQTEVNTLRTDIEKLWKTNQARWITGAGDIDKEWDGYVQQMKNMGIDRYVELHHAAHSRFLNEVGDYR
ncbi:MAG: hypothetical protein OXH96_14380 [Spirochaetaceae bacterium]|nr:hypothetical protein [Spirochaetaceae bacterium]